MKKGKSILSLILVIAVTALFGMTCVLGLDLKGMGAAKNINLGLDLEGGVSITYQVKGDKPSQADMDDTVYKLQKRVEQYSTEAQAYQVGDNRISIEIPGVSDANKILEELGQPGSLYFIKHKDSEGNENYSLTASGYTLNKSIDELKDTDSIVLTGTEVKTASAGVLNDSTTGNKKYGVDLELTDEGAEKFKTATEEAYNNNHDTIAIYYDGSLISVPSVNAVIENVKAIREFAGDRAVLRAFHFFEENKRVDAEVEALEKKDFATFFNKITESGDSSWKWLQNCYCNETPDEQSITVALALTKLYLDKIGRGVCRVHGGGFAGVIAAFLPKEETEGFTKYIDKALGEGSAYVMHIRPQGAVKVEF